ncbi:tetratricopeptide repeat protein, partial [Bacteroidota bacterium]
KIEMKVKGIKTLILATIIYVLTVLIPGNLNAQKVTKFFEKGLYEKAVEYCVNQKGEKQQNCYKELANAYFGKGNYEKADEYYAKSSNPKEGYLKIANAYFGKGNYEMAAEYYAKSNNPEEGYLKIADKYFEAENYDKAKDYYGKAGIEEKKTFEKFADAKFEKEEYKHAASYYEKSNHMEGMLKSANKFFINEEYDLAAYYYEKANNNEGLLKIANKYFELGQENKELFKTEVNTEAFKVVFDDLAKLRKMTEKWQYNLDLYNEYNNKEASTEIQEKEYSEKAQYYMDQYDDYRSDADGVNNSIKRKYEVAKEYFTKAEKHFENAAKYYDKANTEEYSLKMANALFELGTVLTKDEYLFIDKISVLIKAGEYYEKVNAEKKDYYKLAQALYNVGIVNSYHYYAYIYNSKYAIRNAGKYYELAEAGITDYYKIANAFLKLGIQATGQYSKKELLDEAFIYYQKANRATEGFNKISEIVFADESFEFSYLLDLSITVGKQKETYLKAGNYCLKNNLYWDALEIFSEINDFKKIEECYVHLLKEGEIEWFDEYFTSDKSKISASVTMHLIYNFEGDNIEEKEFLSNMKSLINTRGLNLDFFDVLVKYCTKESLLNLGEGYYNSADAYNNCIAIINAVINKYGSILVN